MSERETQPTAGQALSVARVVWGTMGVSQVALVVVVGIMRANYRFEFPQDFGPLLSGVAVAALVVLVPLGLFIRNQVYKANWRGEAVTPGGYVQGNIVLLAMVEAVSFLGAVAILLGSARTWPVALGVVVVAVAVHILNFPNGRPMQPSPGRAEP